MNRRMLSLALTCCGVFVITPAIANAQAPAKKEPAAPPAGKAVQPSKPADKPAQPAMSPEDEAWMKAGTPGEAHKRLEQFAGDWDAAIKMMMPGQPVMESKGSFKSAMRMDGRFLVSHFEGGFMGMPFDGQSVVGYNNITKQYEGTWRDSMSTGMMWSTGTADAAGKTITMKGEFADPTGKKIKQREVWKAIDAGHFTFEAYHEMDGKETKAMEISYTRSKDDGKGKKDAMDELNEKAKKAVDDAKAKLPK